MFFHTPPVATLLRLVFDTSALHPMTTARPFGSHITLGVTGSAAQFCWSSRFSVLGCHRIDGDKLKLELQLLSALAVERHFQSHPITFNTIAFPAMLGYNTRVPCKNQHPKRSQIYTARNFSTR